MQLGKLALKVRGGVDGYAKTLRRGGESLGAGPYVSEPFLAVNLSSWTAIQLLHQAVLWEGVLATSRDVPSSSMILGCLAGNSYHSG